MNLCHVYKIPPDLNPRLIEGIAGRCQPSERFVWAMALLLVALVGLIALEAIYIVVVKQISNELIAGISAVMASLATAFLMGRKQ